MYILDKTSELKVLTGLSDSKAWSSDLYALYPLASVYHVPWGVEREMRRIGVGGKLRTK